MNSVIKFCEETQQGDSKSPVFFLYSIQDLIDSLESKKNIWYLDDGNLSDDYRTVLKDLKQIVEAEKPLGLKTKSSKCETFSMMNSLKNDNRKIKHLPKNIAPGLKYQRKMNLSFLVHRSPRNHKQTYWKKIYMNWKNT